MKSKMTVCALVGCVTLQGCSSRPREFTPVLAAPPSSEAEFEVAYANCHQLFVEGKLEANGRAGSVGAGVAAGAGTAVVGSTAAAAVGGYAGLAAASATIVLLPFAVLGGAWGMARMKRAKKEQAIRTALEGCLHEQGYEVADWAKAAKKKSAGPTAGAAE